jgi:hypothetical protein
MRRMGDRAFFFLAFAFFMVTSAAAQRTSPVLVFAQHNLIFEDNDTKVVLHWMATQQSFAQGIKIVCRLNNPANRAILFEWEGTTPGNHPALGRFELGTRERTMVLGFRSDRGLSMKHYKDLVTCSATEKTGGILNMTRSPGSPKPSSCRKSMVAQTGFAFVCPTLFLGRQISSLMASFVVHYF